MYLFEASRGLLGCHGLLGEQLSLATSIAMAVKDRDIDQVAHSLARYKDFPPGWGHITVPVSSRRAAIAGLGLYSPCRRRALYAHWAARACVVLFGPTALPGRSFRWLPMDEMEWLELSDIWRREIGEFDDVAGYSRLGPSRTGLALLLLRAGSAIAFVKLRQGECGSLLNERLALDAVWSYRPRSFQVPQPLQWGSAAGWHYLISAPLPPGLHRPPTNPPLRAILEEVEAALAGLPKSMATPDHWRPMHGDFAPWNLRQFDRNSLVLVDWESAGWAPPGADEVFYRATQAALRHQVAVRCATDEAVQFWRERVPTKSETARDHQLTRGLREVLGRMAGS